jgi:hypothetical protein
MVDPRKALKQAGATALVSPAKGEVQGGNHFEKGRSLVDIHVEQISREDQSRAA